MKDVVIDIETAGKGKHAAVLSIGAVQCDLAGGTFGAKFYATIKPEDACIYGTADESTLGWWAKQHPDARAQAFGGVMPSHAAVFAFSMFLTQTVGKPVVWGNGPTFDITILENLFDAHRLPYPWQFRAVRDVRTVVDLGERLRGCNAKRDTPFEGTQHNALDDAMHEARYMMQIINELRG